MNIASYIDHTLLKPEATPEQIDQLAAEAIEHQLAAVCVNGCYASRVVERLQGSPVASCAVVDFPLGASLPTARAVEATTLCKAQVHELDFVAHLPHLLAGDAAAAEADFRQITTNARSVNPDIVIKVIIESALLLSGVDEARAEKRIAAACQAARAAGCDYVKTSTGFHPAGGASERAVQLMGKHAGPLKVKASGGIATRDSAKRMIDAGADRIGCSKSLQIIGAG